MRVCLQAVLLGCLGLLVYAAYQHGLFALISANPAAQFTYLGICVLYYSCGSPSIPEGILTAAAGFALLWCPLAHPSDFPGEALVRIGAFAGICAVVALSARAILNRGKQAAKQAIDTLGHALIFIVLGIVLGAMLRAASAMCPYKYDLVLYSIDFRFGLPVSFAAGSLFHAWPLFRQSELTVYHALPLAFAILYAAHIRRPQPGGTDILAMMCLNAATGYALYFLYPASGPSYAFGAAFPASPPLPSSLGLQSILLDGPPNAMPSLHMAGAILIWWNARHWKYGSALALAFMLLTAPATLGIGEHYCLDLIVAFPYALAIQAAATRAEHRFPALAVGVVLTASWFLALRLVPRELSRAPLWLMWSLAIGTIAIPLAASHRLLLRPHPSHLTKENIAGSRTATPELLSGTATCPNYAPLAGDRVRRRRHRRHGVPFLAADLAPGATRRQRS